jgi:hypothetical protein
MKRVRIALVFFVAALSPLSADTITVTATHLGDGIVQVGYSADGGVVPMAVALKVSIIGGNISSPSDVMTGTSAFNVYPDYYFSNPGYLNSLPGDFALPGIGANPLADPSAAGTLNLGTPKSVFSVCMGAFADHDSSSYAEDLDLDGQVNLNDLSMLTASWLYKDARLYEGDINGDRTVNIVDLALLNGAAMMPPSSSANLFTICIGGYVEGQTTLTLQLDTFRGGIAYSSENPVNIILPETMVLVPEPTAVLLLGFGAVLLRHLK